MKDGTVIHYDPMTGEKQKFYYDELTDTVTIKHVWDPKSSAQVLEMNKRLQCQDGDWYKSKTPGETDMWHAAQIPYEVQFQWLVRDGIDIRKPEHWPKVRQRLNDPEYRYLRTGSFSL